ncbi:MAG TPA: DSD1 family PLP-dependent enzyme [Caldimonas sp.]|jgi:D-serine deaminase-like pyridoxal phosphate-dependent protein|nr:DSD1 family PLP-dependent enzyme [Caldimonas sp.]HEX4235042.1 DSD1 family PLP-dependent enzyme [Caldimonas sp.]
MSTTAPIARRGDAVESVDTPALVVDLDAMERNLVAMAAFARERGVRLRPHAKMHKSAAIARLQIAAGAVGVCVQKTSEAEALAAAGIDDIYISNEVVDRAKLDRVAALAARIRLAIAVDSVTGIERLAAAMKGVPATIDVLVEVDVGHGRCGAPAAAAGELALQVVACAPPEGGLRFAGLQAYHGAAQHLRSVAEREVAARHAASLARAAQASVGAVGIACPLVSGGGTGTFAFDAASGVWSELQVGSYLFMDRDYADNAPASTAPRFEHALFVKAQVVSRGAAHAVIDAGHKSHALDSGPPRLWQRDETWVSGGDEHGIVRPAAGGSAGSLPALGETVWLIPGHCDPTVNLHDRYVCVRGGLDRGVVEVVWPIEARGCVS